MRSPQNWKIILHSEPDFVLVQGTQGSIKKINSPLKTWEFDLDTSEFKMNMFNSFYVLTHLLSCDRYTKRVLI